MPYWYTDASRKVLTDGKGNFIPAASSNRDYAALVAGGTTILTSTPPAPVPDEVEAWQLVRQLRLAARITPAEALAWMGTCTAPAVAGTAIAALPAAQQQDVKERFCRPRYRRDDSLLASVWLALLGAGKTADDVDQLFRDAALP